MKKLFSIEYEDVKTVIGAGTGETGWVGQEFSDIDLSDKRLNKRAIKVVTALAKSTFSPINEACGGWSETQAAYRFFDNPKADTQQILRPHQKQTVKRMSAYNGTVLAVQDTVFFSYGKHPNTKGLGPIGKDNSSTDQGLVAHNALAFTTDGLPLGILSQHIWARDKVPEESRSEKTNRLQCTPIELKESSKWLIALDETTALAPPHLRVVTVTDREGDFFEFMDHARNSGRKANFLIRARVDRKLDPDDNDGFERISNALGLAPVSGTEIVKIPSNGKRKARDAHVEIRFAEVTLPPPHRRGEAKPVEPFQPITVHVISAMEPNPPQGEEAISWILLTNLPVKTYEEALEKVAWYRIRWGIEIWHKVLKSGCTVEECLLETADRLKRFLALFSVIGFRLLHITYLARVNPEAPAISAFTEQELEVLHVRVNSADPEKIDAITMREAVRMIGSLGGHLGRKCDGEPGITVLWRGFFRLHEDLALVRAYQRKSKRQD